MLQKIKERIFPFIIALSALSVSASAAYYSVTGLSMLFAGASVAVLIMASSLEISKLVIVSLLYQYWDKLNSLLRSYLTLAATILILITSAGIYGFLSGAYQTTANQSLDKIINWFLLVIIFVFDPLAISLVIAANFAFARLKLEPPPEVIPEPTQPIYQPPTQPNSTSNFLNKISNISESNMDFINKQEHLKKEIERFKEETKTYF
jgi:hypothetical protein